MKYIVQAQETVYYDIFVNAENEDQARESVLNGEVDIGIGSDSEGFMVTEIYQA